MRFNKLLAWRFLQLLAGLAAFGVGIGLMVRGALGVAPWDVLAQGVSAASGISFGLANVIISCFVLLLWIPLRQKPGIGTVLNALMIGPVAQGVLVLLPEQDSIVVRILLLLSGIIFIALGTGMYIGASFGPGPRDGLMTGLNSVTGLPIWIVRTGIELSVLIVGWILGGDVGVGTVLFALFIGPLAQPAMVWFNLSGRVASAATKKSDDEADVTKN
ncbi:MAG TPA: hypothetical protein VLZ31_06515 [Microbacteriaceae bacterium]|nr:hypothetical protein [Microbacteriaceae bacterium]